MVVEGLRGRWKRYEQEWHGPVGREVVGRVGEGITTARPSSLNAGHIYIYTYIYKPRQIIDDELSLL